MFNKKSLIVAFVLTISLIFLIYTFKDVEYLKLIEVLKSAKYEYLILWLLMFVIGTCIRTLRWGSILLSENLSFSHLFHSLNIGNLASMILPFRAGEFVRPYYLAQWTSISLAKAIISVILERVFDVLGMFVVFYIFVKDIPDLPSFINLAASGLGLICFIIISVMVIARFFPEVMRGFAKKCLSIAPESIASSVMNLFEEVLAGLVSIKTLSQLLIIILYTLIIWFSYAYTFSIIFSVLGHEASLSIGAVACVFVGLAIAAPNAPGFFLTFEMGTSAALAVFAYHGEFSLAFALIAHSVQLFATLLIGFFSLWSKGLSIARLKPSPK